MPWRTGTQRRYFAALQSLGCCCAYIVSRAYSVPIRDFPLGLPAPAAHSNVTSCQSRLGVRICVLMGGRSIPVHNLLSIDPDTQLSGA